MKLFSLNEANLLILLSIRQYCRRIKLYDMLTDILNAANRYTDGIDKVKKRRADWVKKHAELKVHLKEIAGHLNDKSTYKQGFFVDTLHAFNEETNGVCNELPSITFRSGD